MASAVSTLIPEPLIGKDFLKASHLPFRGAGNSDGPAHCFQTTFQQDFISSATLPKRPAIPRPAPAQVEHKDLGRIKEYVSEAVGSYPQHPQAALTRTPAWTKLLTNLKMHTDPRHVSFLTTQADDGLKPPPSSRTALIRPVMAIKKSPQHEEKLPETTHRATFTPHCVSPVVKATVKHLGGEPTIKGDMGAHNFHSHHNEAFQGKYCTPPQPVEKQSVSSVAMGDPEKIFLRETTHGVSFSHPGAHSPVSVKKRLRVNLGDYPEKRWTTTTSDAFCNIRSDPVLLVQRNKNLSSVPRGDTDLGRNQESMTATTNRFFFSERNHREAPVHVSGADLRTRSNVHLGRASLGGLFYSTSAQEHYPSRALTRVTPHTHPSSHMLAGQEPGPALTTVQRDFLPHDCRRQRLDSRQLQQIKESHITEPHNQQDFRTTHKEAFGPKPLSRTCLDNPPRQHVSHMPF